MRRSAVVITLPISTTNMTGLPIILRGSSLSSELHAAVRTRVRSQIVLRWLAIDSLESFPRVHQKVLKNWTQAQRREEGQGAENYDDADQQQGEQRRRYGKCAERRRYIFFLRQV